MVIVLCCKNYYLFLRVIRNITITMRPPVCISF
nr:MAG TPA: hypothetical protein [Caudoviricetes sp.]